MIASGSPHDGAGCTAPAGESSTFRVLHVCVGNICRSVLAERLMRHALGARLGADVVGGVHSTSAGTHAVPGLDMDARIAQILRAGGAPADRFITRRLTREHIADADLVLTATRVERDHVVAMRPQALRRTFTLTEFARLAPHAVPERRPDPLDATARRGIVAATLALRGHAGYVDPATDDVPDPAANATRFAACAERIWPAVQAVVAALCATPELGE